MRDLITELDWHVSFEDDKFSSVGWKMFQVHLNDYFLIEILAFRLQLFIYLRPVI